MKGGQRDWNVITTQLGLTLNFTTTEILWCVSEAAEHTSGPQASHYVEGQDTSLLYCLSIRAMATGRLESGGSLIIIHFNTFYSLIMNPCNPWQPPMLPTPPLKNKKQNKKLINPTQCCFNICLWWNDESLTIHKHNYLLYFFFPLFSLQLTYCVYHAGHFWMHLKTTIFRMHFMWLFFSPPGRIQR